MAEGVNQYRTSTATFMQSCTLAKAGSTTQLTLYTEETKQMTAGCGHNINHGASLCRQGARKRLGPGSSTAKTHVLLNKQGHENSELQG